MLPIEDMLALVERAGMPAIRTKSVLLTDYVIAVADKVLAPLGVVVASPRDPDRRAGHVTLEHEAMRTVVQELWRRGIIPDFRPARGLRIGLSPLSTSFTEVATALAHIQQALEANQD